MFDSVRHFADDDQDILVRNNFKMCLCSEKRQRRLRAINRKRTTSLAVTLALLGAFAWQAPLPAMEDIWQTYHDMGRRLIRYEKYGQAEEVLQLAIKTAEENNAPTRVLSSLKELVIVYEAEKKNDKLEETKKRISALESAAPKTQAGNATKDLPQSGSEEKAPEALQTAEAQTPTAAPPPPQSEAQPAPAGDVQRVNINGQEMPKSEASASPAASFAAEATPTSPTASDNPTVASAGIPRSGLPAQTNSPDGEVEARELQHMEGHINWVKAITFSPDARFAASAGFDQSIKYWDLNTGKLQAEFFGHTGEINGVAISADGRTLLSCSDDQSIRLFDIASAKQKMVLNGHNNLVTCVAFAPDGQHVVSGGYDNNVRIWSLSSGNIVSTLKGHTGRIRCVTYTPDGSKVISCGDDNSIYVWDVKTSNPLMMLRGHNDYVLDLALSSDGSKLLSTSRDLTIRLWDLSTGQQIKVLNGHRDWVIKVRFMPGDREALTGSLDKTVRVWNLDAGSETKRYSGFNLGIWSEDLAPDKHLVLTGSNDKSVRLWSVGQ